MRRLSRDSHRSRRYWAFEESGKVASRELYTTFVMVKGKKGGVSSRDLFTNRSSRPTVCRTPSGDDDGLTHKRIEPNATTPRNRGDRHPPAPPFCTAPRRRFQPPSTSTSTSSYGIPCHGAAGPREDWFQGRSAPPQNFCLKRR